MRYYRSSRAGCGRTDTSVRIVVGKSLGISNTLQVSYTVVVVMVSSFELGCLALERGRRGKILNRRPRDFAVQKCQSLLCLVEKRFAFRLPRCDARIGGQRCRIAHL